MVKKVTDRRNFIKQGSLLAGSLILLDNTTFANETNEMKSKHVYDVIIVGGSNAGLAAALALGRAVRKVLVVDSGQPCNHQTPFSHNFLTQDGKRPSEIAEISQIQVLEYDTVEILSGIVTNVEKKEDFFESEISIGKKFFSKKVIFATGIKDIISDIPGLAECWGISVLHCPYCHGYEVRNRPTGILGNGTYGFEFATLLSNWTKDLTIFTNGKYAFSDQQVTILAKKKIRVVEDEILELDHENGYVKNITFKNGKHQSVDAIYTKLPFDQHCKIPVNMGCQLTDDGYIKTDTFQRTTIPGVFACGDNTTKMRTIANAVSMGATAGMMLNRELTEEEFLL